MNNIAKKVKAAIVLCRLDAPFLELPIAVIIGFISANKNTDLTLIIWILLASACGLAIGNAINGYADRKIDRINPRTCNRPVASGQLDLKDVIIIISIFSLIMLFSIYMISPFYFLLLPIPGLLIVIYSFTKRFTWACHIILGITEAAGTYAAWGILNDWWDIRVIISGAIGFFWIVGFDLMYNAQDVEYDKMTNMNSIPARFGVRFSLMTSHLFHMIMVVLCCYLAYSCNNGVIFYIGMAIASAVIIYEHYIVSKDMKKNGVKLFGISQIITFIIMTGSILDFIVRSYT